LILTGAPSVGKTTVARRVAARSHRAVHLESDHFFHFIRSGYVEPWRPESNEQQNRTVMRIVPDAAATYAAAGTFDSSAPRAAKSRHRRSTISGSVRYRGPRLRVLATQTVTIVDGIVSPGSFLKPIADQVEKRFRDGSLTT